MRRGEFARAWEVSDRVLAGRRTERCDQLPRHLQWIWDGRPLDGRRVLVRCYHGLGDTIQFIRYIPMLRAVAAEVIVWAQPPLLTLLQQVAGIDRLLPLHDGAPECDYDLDVEIMELPHIFRTTLETIPDRVPYLTAPPSPAMVRAQPVIALFGRSGNWDTRRDVPLDLLASLRTVSACSWVTPVRKSTPGDHPVGWTLMPIGDDLLDTASVMTGADLVISVDSMPAHLAGALGVPTWTLLHAHADWRWLEQRSDSPWYPTMRLFRQSRPGDWRGVIEEVATALERGDAVQANRIERGRVTSEAGRAGSCATVD